MCRCRGRNAKIHTWVVYPDGTQPAGTVLVLHGASGISDWIRSVADQLAKEGFIALAIDLSSGLGPNGGNFDSFRFTDDLMRATQKLPRDEVMGRIKAVRDFAAKMPRSNGRTGSIGFCGGGTNSFTLATDVAAHNASVVYYGGPPPAASLANTVGAGPRFLRRRRCAHLHDGGADARRDEEAGQGVRGAHLPARDAFIPVDAGSREQLRGHGGCVAADDRVFPPAPGDGGAASR